MRRKTILFVLLLSIALLVALVVHGQSPPLPSLARSEFPVDRANEAMFLVSFGHQTGQPADWSGAVSVKQGKLETLGGYKFDAEDEVIQPNRWRVVRRVVKKPLRKSIYYRDGYGGDPTVGVVITLLAEAGCAVDVTTTRGDFGFEPAGMRVGDRLTALDGEAVVTRLPVTRRIGSTWWSDDYPSLASDSKGALWVVWTGYHAERDEVGLRHYQGGKWSNYLPVPGNQGDVWWPQVLVDPNDDPWVVFSQQVDGNWDLYAVRHFKERNWWSDVERITDHWMADINHQAAIDRDGNLYVVWQALRGENYDILLKVRTADGWSK
ncbi:MAG: hypothetical protein GY953_49255, partial [bacterium]|nr:hypothetical protein [bacterium]